MGTLMGYFILVIIIIIVRVLPTRYDMQTLRLRKLQANTKYIYLLPLLDDDEDKAAAGVDLFFLWGEGAFFVTTGGAAAFLDLITFD